MQPVKVFICVEMQQMRDTCVPVCNVSTVCDGMAVKVPLTRWLGVQHGCKRCVLAPDLTAAANASRRLVVANFLVSCLISQWQRSTSQYSNYSN